MTAPAGPLVQGQPAQFEIAVRPVPGPGLESFTIDDVTGNTLTTKLGTGGLGDGAATTAVTPPYAGIRTYQVTYDGDGTYAESTGSTQVTVVAPVSASSCGLGSSAYVGSSGDVAPQQTTFTSTVAEQSAVCAQNSGTILTLNSPVITKSGADTFMGTTGSVAYGGDPSGIDAGVLAYGSSASTPSGATINLLGAPSITASTANYAVFASGSGATLNLSNATIASTYSGATLGAGNNGEISLTDSQVTSDATLLVILDGGSAVLKNTSLTSGSYAPIIFEGPASGANVTTGFSMTGGSITAADPLVELSGNQTMNIYLSHVDLSQLAITPEDAWDDLETGGTGALLLTLDKQTMQGAITGNAASTLTLENGSNLNGDFLGGGSVTMDTSSFWTIHSSFTLQVFNDPSGISGTQVLNVTGNGQTISYSSALNPELGGMTYSLLGGGSLKPY